jgi:hypothetical protein
MFFTAKFAEKAQRATEFLFGELLCETLRKPLWLSSVIFVTFSVNLTTLPFWANAAMFSHRQGCQTLSGKSGDPVGG